MEQRVYDELYRLEDAHWWFRGRRAVIWALLRDAGLPTNPAILDAGCGTGRNLVEYGRLGSAVGVDFSSEAVAACRERGLRDVTHARLEDMPFDPGSFDLLLACDVIEHIEDDVGALRELRRVASAGAQLVLTVPAYMWLWSHHDDRHHHQRRYTKEALEASVRAGGWRPRRITHFNTVLLPAIAAVRAVGRRRTPREDASDYALTRGLDRVLGVPMAGEARAIARGFNLPAGVSIAMVCE